MRFVSTARNLRFARRLQCAEARFFDAYGRGGSHSHEPLVVPLDYFAHRDVQATLTAWATRGERLDLGALERAWRRAGGRTIDTTVFYRNVAHFLSLMRP